VVLIRRGADPTEQVANYLEQGRAAHLSDEQRGLSVLLARLRGYSRLNLRFHRLHVEARAFLHWRELHDALGRFCNLLLHEDETPELVGEPVVVSEGTAFAVGHTSALVWV
jgi:class 3 adenylate cyclase